MGILEMILAGIASSAAGVGITSALAPEMPEFKQKRQSNPDFAGLLQRSLGSQPTGISYAENPWIAQILANRFMSGGMRHV